VVGLVAAVIVAGLALIPSLVGLGLGLVCVSTSPAWPAWSSAWFSVPLSFSDDAGAGGGVEAACTASAQPASARMAGTARIAALRLNLMLVI